MSQGPLDRRAFLFLYLKTLDNKSKQRILAVMAMLTSCSSGKSTERACPFEFLLVVLFVFPLAARASRSLLSS